MPLSRRAFTLIELSIVVLVLGLLSAAVFRYSANVSNTKNYAALNDTLDTIETALQNYSNSNTRLPCPSDIAVAENSATFGVEMGTSGDGTCGTPTFINSGTDPDNADAPLYDVTTVNQVVAGAVPTKTLKLDDKYAYDPWGRKILFVVDKRATGSGAFTTYTITNTVVGAVVVKKAPVDTLANAITYKGIYALASHGPNGHGGYVRNPSATSVPFNGGSTNTSEQKNCHCSSSAVATAFDRIFVQNTLTPSTTLTNVFDDVVRFKTRLQMANYADLQ